ncbi:MAG: hypothetical protein RI962_623, partial [Pseudomonadota bacterium]
VAATAFYAAPAFSEPSSTVLIEVAGFKNMRGTLNCRLFTKAADFPDGEGIVTLRVPITGPNTSCSFSNVEPGTYAIAVVHDENGNGKLDKNFVGVPSEGYGVSNNKTYALSAPKWDESTFTLGTTESRALLVKLRY